MFNYNDSDFKPPHVSPDVYKILQERYLQPSESPRGMYMRIAKAVAAGDKIAASEEAQHELAVAFYDLMVDGVFLPNSPTIMNAGTDMPNLSACFVLPVEDSMEGIFRAVGEAAIVHKTGGGTGFDFSSLRAEGSKVGSTGGVASGPISFMQVFNAATETIKQGGRRKGANMAVLRVDHPDIMKFISCKSDTTVLTNFNISVAITDEFMEAWHFEDECNYHGTPATPFELTDGTQVSAHEVLSKIAEQAHATGEPGVIFIDEMNRKHPLEETIHATNPCGRCLPHANHSVNCWKPKSNDMAISSL